jgi:F-type H+-transporting ATPase subunit delta
MSTNGSTETEYGIDVGALRIARTYAEALLDAADKQGQTDAVLEELNSLVYDGFPASSQLEPFFHSRAIGRDKKKEVIAKIFRGRTSDIFSNFLFVLNAHDRLDLLRPILIEARLLHEKRTNKVRVQVSTATPLPGDQRDRLIAQLRESLKKEPVLQETVDPNLLGGLVVRVGDWLHDASVQTRLETLKNQLMESSSYEIQRGRDRFVNR